MSNTFLSMEEIAVESLPILQSNLVFANLVHRDYENVFQKKGDTVQVRKPAAFTAVEFDGNLSGEYQNITEGEVDVKLDTIATVDVNVTSKELTLSIDDFMAQVGAGAMVALAEKIDADVAKLAADIPYYFGDAGSTPDALSDIAGVRKVLNNNKAPMLNRSLVVNPDAEAKFLEITSIVNAEKIGTTAAIREASLGRIYGLGLYMNQNIYSHTNGTNSLAAAKATGTAGSTAVTLSSGSVGATVKRGDIFTIAGDTTKYVVTAGCTIAETSTGSISVYPALATSPSNATVTYVNSHVKNIGFVKNAFALVNRPLAPAMGGANSITMNFGGLSIRVTAGYDMDTKTHIISFDTLYGVKTLYPELACVLMG